MERALNDVQGRKDGRISLELERQEIEGARCATDVLKDCGPKGSSFCHQSTGVFGVGECMEPIVKLEQTGVHPRYGNQLLVDIVQASCLRTCDLELPQDHGIRS